MSPLQKETLIARPLKKRACFYLWKKRHTLRAFVPFIAREVTELGVLKAKHKVTRSPEDEQCVLSGKHNEVKPFIQLGIREGAGRENGMGNTPCWL